MSGRLHIEAWHLCLAVLVLSFGPVKNTCLGDGCEAEHAQAKASGLLGSSNDICPDKSYPAKDPLQPVRYLSTAVLEYFLWLRTYFA